MSGDRFNSNVHRKVKTEAARVQRVEVIAGVERRRDWTDEQKLSIIAESCQDDVVILSSLPDNASVPSGEKATARTSSGFAAVAIPCKTAMPIAAVNDKTRGNIVS
jgi:hypothetical protein